MQSDIYTYSEALKFARGIAAGGNQDFTVALGGNCMTRFLEPGIQLAFYEENQFVSIHECDFDAWVADCFAPPKKIDAWILWLSAMGVSDGGVVRGNIDQDAIQSGINAALSRGERLVVILPETIDVALDGYSKYGAWNAELISIVKDCLPDGVVCISPDQLALQHRQVNWYAPSYWSMAKLPLHPDAATVVAYEAGKVLLRCRSEKVKAIVVDLDNTMWGGVVGELGAEGIKLDPSGEGRAFLQFQQLLKDYSDQGVMLAVSSKNNMADAQEPFKIRDEMILTLDDFVLFHANWDNKFKAITDIANELNIGMDSICFLDDSVHEREEAASMLPDLIVPELPENPEFRSAMLVSSGLFMRPFKSHEDQSRVGYYKDEIKRKEDRQKFDTWDGYLNSLEMKLTPHPVQDENLQRVTALINKTNQFNLTTIRYDSKEILKMASDSQGYTYCYSLSDRFGDSGIVGVLLAFIDGDAAHIDTWLLSCRVINRHVERAMYEHFLAWVIEHKISKVCAKYIRTQKNEPIRDLLPDLGHTLVEETGDEFLYITTNLDAPQHAIRIESDI